MYIAIACVYDCICRYTIRDAQNRLENFDIAELVGALSWVPQNPIIQSRGPCFQGDVNKTLCIYTPRMYLLAWE